MNQKITALNFILNVHKSPFRSRHYYYLIPSYSKRILSVHLHPRDLSLHEEEVGLVDEFAFQQHMAGECESTQGCISTTLAKSGCYLLSKHTAMCEKSRITVCQHNPFE